MADRETRNLQEAIIDLYLAIKIRSTEELDKIDENHLEKEKQKLLKQDGFQILEYIRSSIEIIMNLKIEDLEKEMHGKKTGEHGGDFNSTFQSIESHVHASMKEALSNVDKQESQIGSIEHSNNKQQAGDPPKEYEKMLQKLEADIRGHIRLEHEMKIHLDYLEGRVEELENLEAKWETDKKRYEKKLTQLEDKLRSLRDEKEQDERDFKSQLKLNEERVRDLEKINKDLGQKYETLQATHINQQLDMVMPSNQHSAQSNGGYSHNGNYNDKNIYQTLDSSKNQFVTRNNQQMLQYKQSLKNNFSLQMNQLSGNAKKRDNTSKASHQVRSSLGDPITIKGLIDISDRYSKNPQNGLNPYTLDPSTSKKSLKRKSESIDATHQKKQGKLLRNSHNIGQGGGGYHNRSMIEPDQKWLLQSTDSDSLKQNQSLFADYPNGAGSVQRTIQNDSRQINSKGRSNSRGRSSMNTIDDSSHTILQNQKSVNQTIDGTYLSREDINFATRKATKKNSIRQSVDFTQMKHMGQVAKGLAIQRPSSQLGSKSSKEQVVLYQKQQTGQKEKSVSKNRALEELIQLQMKEKERQLKLLRSYATQNQMSIISHSQINKK